MKQEESGERPMSLVLRFVRQQGPWEKKSLLQAIYWTKMILAVFTGLALGIFRLTGAIGNLVFIGVCGVAVQLYVTSVLGVDVEDTLGNASAVLFEGGLPCYAAFLLLWTGINTLFASTSKNI